MKPEVLDQVRDARDFCSLAKAVLSLCEPYGPVHSFKLVHNRGAACLEIPVPRDFEHRQVEEQQAA